MFKYIFLFLTIFGSLPVISQSTIKVTVFGRAVADTEGASLPGATLQWLGTSTGTATDEEGRAQLPSFHHLPHQLVISYIGYKSDTVMVVEGQTMLVVTLMAEDILQAVEITGRNPKSFVSTLNPLKTEMITQGEFRKAACCNLSESFQTNASVDVSYSDAVTGAKEIQMLGLDGVYVQMLSEGIPTLRGISGTFGLSHVPAPWMQSIAVSKGAPSVRNGYEGITGAISIDYKKPYESDKLYLDLFLNHMGRTEVNALSGGKINDKWSGLMFANTAIFRTKMDRNDDTFIDDPLFRQYNVMNRWHYEGKNSEAQIGGRFMYEDREGGQLMGMHTDMVIHEPYTIDITSTHAEVFLKNGYFFEGKPDQSIGYQLNGSWHRQTGQYGLRSYEGKQGSFFGNVAFQTILRNTNHGLVSGITSQYDRFRETFEAQPYHKEEWSTGAYTEYTYKHLEKVTIVAGLRGDYHNIAGFQVTPRLHMRFEPWKDGILRLSAGRGFRTANIFAENTALMASSRTLVIQEELRPEVAWNYGINLHQAFRLSDREAAVSADYFRTDFINQVITDVDGGDNTFTIYNLVGRSFSNSFQTELSLEVARNFDLRIAYKLDDVQYTVDGSLIDKPFIPRHTGLVALSYETLDKQWQFDAHTSMHGKHRLPDSFEGSASRFSPVYAMLNAQVTWRRNGWEVYAGAENITNYTQKDPIVGWEAPFGTNFDTAQAWGPIVGAMGYGGVRYTLK
jgi:outer membrane receptor for ferrienterochelin and colicins